MMLLPCGPHAAAPGLSRWSSYMCPEHSSPWPGEYLMMHMCSALSDLSSSVHLLSCVQLFVTPWTAGFQASLSIISSWSLLKLMSIELVMPSNHSSSVISFSSCLQFFPALVFPNESVSSLHQVAKVLELQLQNNSFQWIFKTELL